jgi:hypothetical protein
VVAVAAKATSLVRQATSLVRQWLTHDGHAGFVLPTSQC